MNRNIARPAALLALSVSISASALLAAPESPGAPSFVRDTGVRYGPWRSSVLGGGGYIQNVVAAPSNPRRFYSYVDVGGVYRSDDGGQSWTMLHGALPSTIGSYEVRGLLVDPRDDSKILVATGSQWAKKAGVYASSDAGKTFSQVLEAQFQGNGGNRSDGFVLARAAQNPNLLAAATMGDGVFLSRDGGTTWKVSGGTNLNPSDIRFDRVNPKQMWMCASGGKAGDKAYEAGFFRSQDGGATWQKLSATSPSEIVQDPVDAQVLVGIFREEKMMRSQDGGATWADFSDGLNIEPLGEGKWKPPISTSAYGALATGPDFILTANRSNSTFWKLKSGSSKWEKIEKQSVESGDWYGPTKGGWFFGGALGSITVDPRDANHWFLTDYFAIYQTRDAGQHWRLTIDGIEVTVSHALLQDPSDPGVLHLGQADIGPATSLDGGARLRKDSVPDSEGNPSGGKNMKCIDLCPKLPNRLYGVADANYYVGWTANQVYVSIDRGQTWQRSPMIGLPDKNAARCTNIAADLDDPYTVYVTMAGESKSGAGGVYKSKDGGASWSWLGAGLPAGGFFSGDVWAHGRELAVGPGGTLLAASNTTGQVFRFDAAASTWVDAGLKHKGKIYSIVADKLKAGRFFVGSRSDGLYRTDDAGATWKKVFERGVAYVATDAAVAGRVAGGTEDGVVLSKDGGETWQVLDKSLPYRTDNIPAFVGERLAVGTGGSGVLWMPLSAAGEKPVAAKPLVIAQVPPPKNPLPKLANGDMSAASPNGAPANWEIWAPQGKLKLSADAGAKSAPAALLLASDGGASYGAASQTFEAVPGTFTISGVAKSQGKLDECQVAIQSFDKDWKQVGWTILLDVPRESQEWKAFSVSTALPAGAARCKLLLSLKGEGKAWLDDVAFSRAEALFLN